MNLSRNIFWDVDYNTLDWEKHDRFVICRVLERGEMNDWFEIKKYYGIKKIISEATSARYLSKLAMHFISNAYDVPLKNFRCYNEQQYNPGSWLY